MRKSSLRPALLLALLCSLLLPLLAAAQTPPIRIMPLGDSITDGTSAGTAGYGGYRRPLYYALTGAGYNVDYIGSLTNNGSQIPDQDHEGHSGWRIDQLDSNIAAWFASYGSPDVVLMHIGTNDFGQNYNISTAIDRLDALILKIANLQPNCRIIVTNLMERSGTANTNIQSMFNPYVQDRVNAHAAAGRLVTFLNMRAVVPLTDMPDQLHPNQTGYDKMAAAWLPAIQAVISTDGDPPAISRAVGNPDLTHVAITFSKPVADSAATVGNFALSGGLTVSAAVLDTGKRTVTLTTSLQVLGATYTATVNGVVDRTAGALPLAANSTVNFIGATPRGYLNNVPESASYTLACSLDIPSQANYGTAAVPYTVDNRNGIGPFTRVAYYMELQGAAGDLQYVWASVDAFTADVGKIAVPTAASGAVFQQGVTGMNVVSNVPGIIAGTGLAGNMEFWPTSYTAGNAVVPTASAVTYDFGDTRSTGGTYGSMQLHNTGAGQTLFGFNNWGGTATAVNADLGIGNNPAPVNGGVDWTFANNAGIYTVKTLQVLVQTTGDFAAPTPVSARATFGRTGITATFSEPLAAASVRAENFTLTSGVVVLGTTLAANQRDVVLLTTSQPAGTPLTLTVSGVRDSSPNANLIAPGSTVAVAAAVLPAEIVANIGAASSGYHLVASIALPTTGNFNAGNSAYTFDERAATGPFSRIAYYMELQQSGGPVRYAWASMDAFTGDRAKLGPPTAASATVFQQNVLNLDVLSNMPGVVNGPTAAGGNIEIWPTNYSAANALSVPNASATTYDFGDTRTTTGTYGCWQIHNHDVGAAQTIMAVNNFGADGLTLDIGIGNNAAPVSGGVDWTFANNAGTYIRRILHILVLPAAPPASPANVLANVPEAAGYQLVYSLNIPASGNLTSGAGFTAYSADYRTSVGTFSRIAYYLELRKTSDTGPKFIWTSMDAFTTDVAKIGVPNLASGATFQQVVGNLNVVSNVVSNATGISTGNIEFWPTNYTQAVTAGILPGNPGSSATYDFNDTRTAGTHGSMQVHNYGAGQTLFAINNWGAAGNTTNALAMGIGSQATGSPDWTSAANGASYDVTRILHVFVLPGDTIPPLVTAAKGSATLGRLIVSFNEPVADSAASGANFSIPGLTVTGAALLAGQKDIALTTSAQTSGAGYTVNVSGVRDRAGNVIAPGASAAFTAYTPPAVLANVPETSGYRLIYRLAIPSATPQWNLNAIPYSVDEARYGEQLFDRVAYLVELDGNWIYTSFDRHTAQIAKVGVPTLGVSATAFQQNVANLNVATNVAGIAPATGIATGNIEFWGGDYSAPNAIGIPNASATLFDFGDTMSAAGGHGSMQVHNYGTSQTLFAYNNWGSNAAQISALGIGNNPNAGSAGQAGTQAPDWTFTASASNYTVRNLYVLVRPGGTPTGTAPALFSHPTSRAIAPGGATTFAIAVSGAGPFTYQWRRNGVAITGATNPWLDLSGIGAAQTGTYDVVVTGANLVPAASRAATLSLAGNQPPTFGSFAFTTQKNTAALIARAALLAKAADPDGDTPAITAVSAASAQGGSVTLGGSDVTYAPATGFLGADSFTLTIGDGRGGSVVGTVNATVTTAAPVPAGQSSVAIRVDGKVDVLFTGTPGQSYQIQRSIGLGDPLGWTTLITLTAGDDGLIPFTDPAPPAGDAFYRTSTTQP